MKSSQKIRMALVAPPLGPKAMVVPGAMWMYNLTVAQDHTYTVGKGQWVVHNCGGSWQAVWNNLSDGIRMNTSDALDTVHAFLEDGYVEVEPGRFLSADGTRQVHMFDSDILGWHGGGPHINLNVLTSNPLRPGRLWTAPGDNIHIFLDDTLSSIIDSIIP